MNFYQIPTVIFKCAFVLINPLYKNIEMVIHLKMGEGADFFRGVTDCRSSFCLSVFTSEKLHPLLNMNIYKTVSQYDEQDLYKRPKSRGKITKA